MRNPMRYLVLLVAALRLLWTGSVPVQAAVIVSIRPRAKLTANGGVREVVVESCDPGDQVLEAHLSVSQDDQTVSGLDGIPVRSDGKSRKYRVTVSPLDGTFHPGDAFASAFVLICTDPPTCGMTEQAQHAGTVTVH